MKNITELSKSLAKLYTEIESGGIDMKQATELNNTAGKIISAHKTQLAYHALRGESPVIPFLAGDTVITETRSINLPPPLVQTPWPGSVTKHKLEG